MQTDPRKAESGRNWDGSLPEDRNSLAERRNPTSNNAVPPPVLPRSKPPPMTVLWTGPVGRNWWYSRFLVLIK